MFFVWLMVQEKEVCLLIHQQITFLPASDCSVGLGGFPVWKASSRRRFVGFQIGKTGF